MLEINIYFFILKWYFIAKDIGITTYIYIYFLVELKVIWIFDSGFGWLQTLKYFHKLYPEYDYVFLADNKNCPFGTKSAEEIQKITFDALHWFFDNEADIVIIACNTAAAYSIRKWQTLYPDKKVLSITVPGVEEIISQWNVSANVWVLATQATIISDIYTDLFGRFWGQGNPDFHFVVASELVNMIEQWISDNLLIEATIQNYLNKFSDTIKYLVLWCTHFPIYMSYFERLFQWKIIDPSWEAAKKFGDYLDKHLDLKNKLSLNWSASFLTTWDENNFDNIGSIIWGEKIKAKKIII